MNAPSTPIRVSIVEDHEPTREMLVALISGTPGLVCTGAHPTAEQAVRKIPIEKPAVVLLDLGLPGMDGRELTAALKGRLPGVGIIVLTVHDEPQRLFPALEAGAVGYLVKPVAPAEIVAAIQDAHSGGAPMSSQIARLVIQTFHRRGHSKQQCDTLTPREQEILSLLAKGHNPKEIAELLGIAIRTVGSHLHHVYEKLHVHTQSQAVAKYLSR